MMWALNMFRMFRAICNIFQNFKRTPWNGDFCSLDTYHESLYPSGWVSPEEGGYFRGWGHDGVPTMWPVPWCMWCACPPKQNGRYLWKYNLPATSLAGGKNLINFQYLCDDIINSSQKFCPTGTPLHTCLKERPSVFTFLPKVLHLCYCSGYACKMRP